MIEEMLKTHVASVMKENPKSSQKKYKTTFKVRTSDENLVGEVEEESKFNPVYENEICVRLLKVNEDTVCVEFTNLEGPQLPFLKVFNEIKMALDCTNDVLMQSSDLGGLEVKD